MSEHAGFYIRAPGLEECLEDRCLRSGSKEQSADAARQRLC